MSMKSIRHCLTPTETEGRISSVRKACRGKAKKEIRRFEIFLRGDRINLQSLSDRVLQIMKIPCVSM